MAIWQQRIIQRRGIWCLIGCRQYTVFKRRPYEEEKVKEVRKKDKEERFNMNSEENTSNNVFGY